jgi:hypothetical protein
METEKFRVNYDLYAKIRKYKHEERTQIFDDSIDRLGVRINWEHFGKVMEEKNRRLNGESVIIKTDTPINKKMNLMSMLNSFFL